MPGFSAGSAYLDLVPRLQKGWSGAVEKEVGGLGKLRGAAAGAGKAIGLGLAAGVVGGGALLIKMGADLDDALDNIETKTGFVGKKLESVQDTFRATAKRVPDDLGKVSDAVAGLAQKTGLSGKPLEDLSVQMLTLSRITKQDLGSTIEQSTRFFGDWGLAVEEQGPALDSLFRLSQQTGVGVGDLQERLVKFGGPLRQLGFSWEESAAMIGKFQKEGVNTDLVLGSMRISLGKMAKAGEDPQKTLARVTDEIKNAGSAGEANAKAIELFGARAGPDMAAAIREGRFEVDDLVKSMKTGKTTIESSAKSTDDFGEKWGALRNRITLAVEPIAGKMFDAVNKLFDALVPVGDWLAERLPGALESAEEAVAPFVGAIEEVFSILAKGDFTGKGPWSEDSPIVDGLFRLRELIIEKVIPAAKTLFEFLSRNAKPILAAVGAAFLLLTAPISTIVLGLIAAYVRFEGFRNVVDAVIAWLIANVPPTFELIRSSIAAAVDWIATNVVPVVRSIAETIVAAFSAVVAWVQENWPAISEAIGHVLAFVRGIVEGFVAVVLFLWQHFGDEILEAAKIAWSFIRSTIENAVNLVRSIIETVLALINGDWGKAWDGLKGIASAIWDQIVNIVSNALKLLGQVVELLLSALRVIWDKAWDGMKSVLGSLWDGLTDAAKAALNAMLGALEKGINLAIGLLNDALDGIDKAAGPWVNFGEIPDVDLPELRGKGGPVRPGHDYLVGEAGPEWLRMGTAGGMIFSNSRLRELGRGDDSSSGGISVAVDARGIQDPENVADLTARRIGWHQAQQGGKR